MAELTRNWRPENRERSGRQANGGTVEGVRGTQKTKRKPIWPCLGLLYWLLITPKPSLPNVVLGKPNLGVLKALKKSPRISRYRLSVNSTLLEMPRSILWMPGERQ